MSPGQRSERDADVRADAWAPPDRQAVTGAHEQSPRKRRRRRGEAAVVPDATFESYYGKPIIKPPTWSASDIAGYLFLGGLAGGSSVLAAGAELTGRHRLGRATKIAALTAITGSLAALIHDLGRPARFVNMLRVFKPTSPMSVGSWILSAYGPPAALAAVSSVTGWFPRTGRAATLVAGALGPAVASYTGVLIADTAVPTWHDAHRELPFLFVASGASAAAGLAVLASPTSEAAPARRVLVVGTAAEFGVMELMRRRGLSAETLSTGTAGRYLTWASTLSLIGVAVGGVIGRRSRTASAIGGAAVLAASALTRFGVFAAGVASAEDPKYTVVPQRERLERASGPANSFR
jgi:formate-dependent nitrite reductase membrane component NrfD